MLPSIASLAFARSGSDGAACVNQLAEIMALWSTPFLPNLMNSTVFLVETAQIIAVLFVNYKGRPWMNGLLVRLTCVDSTDNLNLL